MLIVLTALLCIPPLLGLMACARRRRHVLARGHSGGWMLAGMLFSLTVLAVNAAVLVDVGISAGRGTAELGRLHALAAGLAWVCFWLWLYVVVVFRRRQRMVY